MQRYTVKVSLIVIYFGRKNRLTRYCLTPGSCAVRKKWELGQNGQLQLADKCKTYIAGLQMQGWNMEPEKISVQHK